MKDSNSSFYSIKTLYHLYISDPFWKFEQNAECFIQISLEYTEKYIYKFFKVAAWLIWNWFLPTNVFIIW